MVDADRLPGTGRDLHRGRAARGAAPAASFEPLRTATVHDAILAVERGEAERALVPFENSIEGSVRSTLDTLAFDAERGDDRRRARLRRAARPDRPRARSRWSEIEAVLSHPQPLAQCARFLREQPAGGRARAASAAPPRRCGWSASRTRALGGDRRPLGGRALRLHDPARGDRGRGRQRHPLRLDRPARDRAGEGDGAGRPRWSSPSSARTTPGALVEALRSSPAATST